MNLIRRIIFKGLSLLEEAFLKCLPSPEKYGLKKGYHHRLFYFAFDDRNNTDKHQDEVYAYAREIFDNSGFTSVLDFGCGSGFKLIKYFSQEAIEGQDVEKTVNWLQQKYPENSWRISNLENPPTQKYDLIICSDVIEHFKNPNHLLEYLQKIKFERIVLSTPNRDVLSKRPGGRPDGPPRNIYHFREWGYDEFANYISPHLNILKHHCDGENQIILATPKQL